MFFSIIIPTYNRSSLILNTLISIKNQNYQDYEVIIVDDGSSDDTKIVVEGFIKDNSLFDWHYFFKNNAERGAARNYGIERAKGKWVTFLDSDDLFYPNHLQLVFDFIMNYSDAHIIHSAYEYRLDNNSFLREVNYPEDKNLNLALLEGNFISCFGMFIKSELLTEFKFDENRQLSGTEDWLLWLRLSARFQIYFQPQVSGCMIQHEGRSILKFKELELLNRVVILVEKLKQDDFFINKYGIKSIQRIEAHMYTYSALHLVLSRQKHQAIDLFLRGLKINPLELFSRRTLAFIKYLLFS